MNVHFEGATKEKKEPRRILPAAVTGCRSRQRCHNLRSNLSSGVNCNCNCNCSFSSSLGLNFSLSLPHAQLDICGLRQFPLQLLAVPLPSSLTHLHLQLCTHIENIHNIAQRADVLIRLHKERFSRVVCAVLHLCAEYSIG